MSASSSLSSIEQLRKPATGQATGQPSAAVTVELMQDFQRFTPASASAGFCVVPTSSGDAELYTLDNNGHVWRTTPDPSSDTGWTTLDLEFGSDPAVALTAVLSSSGITYVFASTASNNGLKRWASNSNKWSGLKRSFPKGASPTIKSMAASEVNGQINLATIGSGGDLFWQTKAQSSPSNPQWVGQGTPEIYACCMGQYAASSTSTQPLLYFAASTGLSVASFSPSLQVNPIGADTPTSMACACPSSTGGPTLFVVLDGVASCLQPAAPSSGNWSPSNGYQPPTAALYDANEQVSTNNVNSIATTIDGNGDTHVFVTGLDGRLYHTSQTTQDASGWFPATPIAAGSGIGYAQAVTTSEGAVEVFALAAGGSVIQGMRPLENGVWSIGPLQLDIAAMDAIEQITSYSATLTAYGADGNIAPCLGINIACDSLVHMTIEGRTILIGPNNAWQGNVGPEGQLMATFVAQSLGAPSPTFVLDGMDAGNPLALDFSGPVRCSLDAVTNANLATATTASSYKMDYSTGPLLTGESTEQLDVLVETVNAIMDLAVTEGEVTGGNIHPRSKPLAVRQMYGWDRRVSPNRIDRHALPESRFVIDLSQKGRLGFQRHDAASMAAWLEAAHQHTALPDSLGSIWGDICDFVEAVIDEIVDGVQVAINSVAGVATATVTFVMDGLTHVWDVAVGAVEEFVDLVVAVFDCVSVTFSNLVGWLGWIFNWGDILLTKELLSGVISAALPWVAQSLQTAQSLVTGQIAQVQSQLDQLIQAGLGLLPEGATLGSLLGAAPAPAEGTATASDPRNVFLRGLKNNATSCTTTVTSPPSSQEKSAASSLMSLVQSTVDSSKTKDILSSAEHAITPSTSLLDMPLTTIAAAIQSVIGSAFSLVADGVNTTFTGAQSVVGAATGLFSETWEIPLVTDLYAWITDGAALTAQDVVCLLIAIPVTITYKALFGETPVADATALQQMLASLPPVGGEVSLERSPAGDLSNLAIYRVGAVAQAIISGVMAVFEPLIDMNIALYGGTGQQTPTWAPSLNPNNSISLPKLSLAPKAVFVGLEAAASLFGAMTTVWQGGGIGCGSATAKKNLIWLLDNLLWVLDLAMLFVEETTGNLLRAVISAFGSCIVSLFAIGELIAFGFASFGGDELQLGDYAMICTMVTRLPKFLLIPPFNPPELPAGGLVVAAADALGNGCAAALWIAGAALPPSDIARLEGASEKLRA